MEQTNEFGTIQIRDLIGDCNEVLGMFLIDVVKQFKAQPTATKFKVYIQSEGGDIVEGFKIRDYFEHLKADKGFMLMTIGEKIVASTATILHGGGSEGMRFLKSDCQFMIHSPSGGVRGSTRDIRDYADMIENVDSLMADSYEETYSLPRQLITEMMGTDTYLTAQDCEDLGIAQIYNETPIVARAIISNK